MHLVGCLYYCNSNAQSNKYQIALFNMPFEMVTSIKNSENSGLCRLSKRTSQIVTNVNKCSLQTSDTNIRFALQAVYVMSSKVARRRNPSQQYVRNLILTSQKTHCIYITKLTRSMIASKRYLFKKNEDLSSVKHSKYLLTYLLTYLPTYLLHGAESFLRS